MPAQPLAGCSVDYWQIARRNLGETLTGGSRGLPGGGRRCCRPQRRRPILGISHATHAPIQPCGAPRYRTQRSERPLRREGPDFERYDGAVIAIEVKLAHTVDDRDVRHLHWLGNQLGERRVDKLVIHAGPAAYRRPDGVAVVPLTLLG